MREVLSYFFHVPATGASPQGCAVRPQLLRTNHKAAVYDTREPAEARAAGGAEAGELLHVSGCCLSAPRTLHKRHLTCRCPVDTLTCSVGLLSCAHSFARDF